VEKAPPKGSALSVVGAQLEVHGSADETVGVFLNPIVDGVTDILYDLEFPPLPQVRALGGAERWGAHVSLGSTVSDSALPCCSPAQSAAPPRAFRPTRRSSRKGRRHGSRMKRSRVAWGRDAILCLKDALPPPDRVACDKLLERYDRLAAKTGVEAALSMLKKASGEARSQWILSNGSFASAQFSFLGRSLPPGTPAQLASAIAAHRVNLSRNWKTDASILERISAFGKKWALRFCSRSDRMESPDLPSLSSCTGATVRGGGQRGLVASLGTHPRAQELYDDPLLSHLPPQDRESVVFDSSLVFHGAQLLETSHAWHEVVGLTEPGLKTRVITKSPVCFQLLGHVPRKRLLGGLKRDRRSQSTLIGVEDASVLSFFEGCSSGSCVSTDLTAATDLLPLDLCASLIDGLQASGRFTQMEIEALRILTGPQRIRYGPSQGDCEITSQGGVLMGLPVSWCILSLIHIFWWESAIT